MKFGGTSVKDAERVRNVAGIVTDSYKQGNSVVVVVSAQGDTTDDLIAKAAEITSKPTNREMDMLLASGEQISASLLAMCIQDMGYPAISLTGWQAGFMTSSAHTSARIRRVQADRIRREIDLKKIVVVCGFQGISRYDDITTLGRGGSDTSAVAIAAAMHADLCQIYTDVEGVFTADPRKVPNARKLKEISYLQSLKAGRLLKAVADSEASALGNAHIGYIHSVIEDLSRGRLNKSHNNLCESGLTAAVRAGKNYKFRIFNIQIYIIQNNFCFAAVIGNEG